MHTFWETAAARIRFLLQSTAYPDSPSVLRELCEFADHGSEGGILLLQSCLDQIDFHGGVMINIAVKPDIVSAIFHYLLGRPNFCTVFCGSLRNEWNTDQFLGNLSKVLNLSTCEKIAVGLALSNSGSIELKARGQNFCIAEIEVLCANHASGIPCDLIQEIIMFLSQSEALSKHIDSFTKMLSLLRMDIPFFLTPMLAKDRLVDDFSRQLEIFSGSFTHNYDDLISEMERDMSPSDIMMELGYGCTADTLHCKKMLGLFLPLTQKTIARILTAMVHTSVGLEDKQSAYTTFCTVLDISPSAELSHLSSWDINVFIDSVAELAPETNWKNVMGNLDLENFYIPDEDAFSFLMNVYSTACKDPFPLSAICGSVWKNAEGQLSFLRHAAKASADVFTFAHAARRLPNVDPLQLLDLQDNQAWLCLDFLEILCLLAERGHSVSVREIIDIPLRKFPDVLLLGMSHCHTAYNLLQQEICSSVFLELLNNPEKVNIIRQVWDANSSLLLREFVRALSVNPDCITRIIDLCEELKILLTVLNSVPLSTSIKMAAFAFQKNFIDLEKWLSDGLNSYKDTFYEVCFQFLKGMLHDDMNDGNADHFQHSVSVNAPQKSFSVIFKVLQSFTGQIHSQKISDEIKSFFSQLDMGIQNAETVEMPESEGNPDDVETEANTYFHQMFSGKLGIDAMVQMLARFKDSDDKREQRIFDCMIQNLFDEYKFFPKYPEKQLKIAAVLFGSLIKNQLVTHLTLGIALRCVLDALRKSLDSKMFVFGAKALEQFTDRLIEWPQYCNHILQISHLRTTHADLVSFIERALARISSSQADINSATNNHVDPQQGSAPASTENSEQSVQTQQRQDDKPKSSGVPTIQSKVAASFPGQTSLAPIYSDNAQPPKTLSQLSSQVSLQQSLSGQPAASSSPSFPRPARATTPDSLGVLRPSFSTGFGAALNIETLVAAAERRDTPIEAPASEVQDKVFFMINNISSTNIETKAKEFTEIVKEQYYPWFAQYMVMKRASIEPNFHDLYLKFLDKVNSRSLNKEIVKATYENCKVLLRSDLIKSSSEERSLLKNLGSWLGKSTIGRNQVLRAREIDPKSIIIEAYERGLMIAVIPFTSKIIEPCKCSLAYQPPNPWTMAVLGLLVEIYNLPNLKMNLKFDIEVLFKNLGVDFKDVTPSTLLKDRVREVEGNPDFSIKDIVAPHSSVVAENSSSVVSASSTVDLQHQVSGTSHPGVHSNTLNQYTSSLHLSSGTQVDDDKLGTSSIADRTATVQTQSQTATSQPSFASNLTLSQAPNFVPHIIVNSKLSSLGFQMQLQRIIPTAIERAVREIITPVVQRSVTIASQTTKELALKDYAMESDEGRIRNAAHLMVASLASSLAHVTCKEPLRVALSAHLRSLMPTMNISGDVLEQAVQLVTNDNLDLGCALIEHAATDKALQAIDAEIGPSIAFRKKQREASGSTYYDAGAYAQGPYARVPEALRPKPGRLAISQQRVYEEFVRFPWHNQSSHTSSVVSAPASFRSSEVAVGSSLPRAYGASGGLGTSAIYSAPAAQSSDLISEEMDPASGQVLSAPLSRTGTIDSGMQQLVDTSSAISQFSLTSGDLLITEARSMPKEFGAVMQPSIPSSERPGVTISEPLLTTGDALDKYQIVAQKLEATTSNESRDLDIQGIISEVLEIISKCANREEAALAVGQKVFNHLYDHPSTSIHTGASLAILADIRDMSKSLVKELTNWVICLDEDRKLNKDITIRLIHTGLLNVSEYGLHLSKVIDGGRNKAATEYVTSLFRSLLLHDPGYNFSGFRDVIDVASQVALHPGSSESLQQLLEVVINRSSSMASLTNTESGSESKIQFPNIRPSASMEDYVVAESAGTDHSGFTDQVTLLFNEWAHIHELPMPNEAACTHYISQLQQNGLLKGDDQTDRFFQTLMDFSVGHCIASEKAGPLSFQAIDLYAKLVFSILKLQFASADQSSKFVLFPKILSVTIRGIQRDAEEKKLLFNPRPYFRLFIDLLLDLTSPDPALDNIQFVILTYLANAFHALQPLKVPGWSFAWLELIGHRNFMPRLLVSNNQKGWPFFQRLLVDLFKFMEPYLRNAELAEPVQFLYKGTLRVLLVLLHDFPEFLCDYHFSFCDVIAPSCIQMRNVILSAFPVNMRLPDPCTPNLKIDLLPEISQSPRILSDIDNALKVKQIKGDIDEYLKTRLPGQVFLAELKQRLLLSPQEASVAGTRYNVPLINSLVLYVGTQQQQSKLPSPHTATFQVGHNSSTEVLSSSAMDIFNTLVVDLDTEGRYHFLNAVANQLRYPNNHTHYFSCVLLYLFAESSQDIIREQITRVLLERLIVNRPHPWGLLITFIELIKNPRYNFWKQSFIHCAPDIEKLFESVSRSCGASRGLDESLVSGALSDGGH